MIYDEGTDTSETQTITIQNASVIDAKKITTQALGSNWGNMREFKETFKMDEASQNSLCDMVLTLINKYAKGHSNTVIQHKNEHVSNFFKTVSSDVSTPTQNQTMGAIPESVTNTILSYLR